MKRKSLLTIMLFCLMATMGLSQNYLNVSGNKLLDSNGNIVRLTGVNWFGFETSQFMPHGLWSRDCKSMLQQIKDQGFNCIRIPWCNDMLAPGAQITSINAYGADPYTGVSPMNEYEATLETPIELLDVIVEWCQENDMKIILDNHSRQHDGYMNELLWYTSQTPESKWIEDWVFMANRYQDYDAVVGMDINNEPHGSYGNGARWGTGNTAVDWNTAAEKCGNAILQANPNVLILVEGVEEYGETSYWWGGNLQGVRDYPVQLSKPDKLMYSPHEYGPTVHNQEWFSAPDFPANMPGIWEENFNFIHTQGISPLLIGEFGIRDAAGTDEIWFDTFMDYMSAKGYSWTFWCWNPNSGDTGGLLNDQWTDIVTWKMDKLRPHLAAEIPNGGNPNPNTPPNAVASASPTSGIAPMNVDFSGSGSSDADGSISTYSWNFDDGTTGTGENILHSFSSAGVYQVILTVTDNRGATDQATLTITVEQQGQENNPPSAVISVNPTTGTEPLTVSFSASGSSDPDGDALSYSWSFGDGANGTGLSISHTYNSAGNYVATLTVTDGNNGSDQASINITVESDDPDPNTPPVAVILADPSSGTDPLTVSFDASGSSDADGDALSYSWNFGDGASASGLTASHTYTEGSYSATLTVSDGTDSDQASINIIVDPDNNGSPCESPEVVTLSFAMNGSGQNCYYTADDIAYVNSWNMNAVEINGVDYTNTWSNSMPAKIDGGYYFYYDGAFPWSHFEASAAKAASESIAAARDIRVYPNPFSEELNIDVSSIEGINRVEVLNSLGQLVQRIDLDQTNSEIIHINIVEPGSLFILHIATDKQTYVKSLVRY